MRILVLLATLASLLLHSVPVQAGQATPPGQKPGEYVRWYYPTQLPYGTIEDGTGSVGPASSKAFLTLPFMGPHIVTSGFGRRLGVDVAGAERAGVCQRQQSQCKQSHGQRQPPSAAS